MVSHLKQQRSITDVVNQQNYEFNEEGRYPTYGNYKISIEDYD